MPNISQVEVNGTTYDICDATARDDMSSWIIKTSGSSTNVTIASKSLGYIGLGTWNAHPGYDCIGVALDCYGFGDTYYPGMLNGGLTYRTESPYALYVRIYNNNASSVTGTVKWTLFWAKCGTIFNE